MKQGEIWLIDLDPTIGAEVRKSRPSIIVNDNNLGILPLKVIVPLTDWKERFTIAPWMVKIIADENNGLSKDSAADCFQVRSVSEQRFNRKIGLIDTSIKVKIKKALDIVFTINF